MVYLLILFVCCLSSCSKAPINKEFQSLRTSSLDHLGTAPPWLTSSALCATDIEDQLKNSLTIDHAAGIALQNNPQLHADLEHLGIAKADLIQAGFFTNPHIETVFRIPHKSSVSTDIELNCDALSLSDFWIVPRKKQVAQDALALQSTQLLRTIIDTTAETKLAYIDTLHAHARLELFIKNTQRLADIEQHVHAIEHKDVTNKRDQQYATIRRHELEASIIDQNMIYKQKNAQLCAQLGLMTCTPLTLEHNSLEPLTPIMPLNQLIKHAHTYRPELSIAQLQIQKAEHQLSLEKASIFDNVTIGLGYERDDARISYIGPRLSMDIPLFDTNSGAVERAQYELERAKKECRSFYQQTRLTISRLYYAYEAQREQYELYANTIVPSSRQAAQLDDGHFESTYQNAITTIESQLNLYETELNKLDLYYDAHKTLIQLEQAIGVALNQLPAANHA